MKRTVILVSTLTALTVANVGFQYTRSHRSVVAWDTALMPGAALPALDVTPLRATGTMAGVPAALPSGCRLLVLFSVDCVHCHNAAARDAATWDSTWTVPIVWLTNVDDSSTAKFVVAAGPHAQAWLAGPATLRALKAPGVPAGFLVSAHDTLLWTGPYGGGATDQHALHSMCSGAGDAHD